MSFLGAEVLSRRAMLEVVGYGVAGVVLAGCESAPSSQTDSGISGQGEASLQKPVHLATIAGGFPGGVTSYVDANGYHRALAVSTPARGASDIGNALYSVPLTGGGKATATSTSSMTEPSNLGDPLALDMGGEVITANNGIVFRGPDEATGRFISFPDTETTHGLTLNTGMGIIETAEGVWIATANMKDTALQNSGYNAGSVLFYPLDSSGNILADQWQPVEVPGVNATSIGKTADGRVVVLSAGNNFDSASEPYLSIVDPKTKAVTEINLADFLGFNFVGQFSGRLATGRDSHGEFVVFGTTKSSANPNDSARVIKVYLDLSDAQVANLASDTVTGVDILGGGLLVAGLSETGEVISFRSDSMSETSRVVVTEDGTDEQVGRLVSSAFGVVVNVNGRSKNSRVVLVGVE